MDPVVMIALGSNLPSTAGSPAETVLKCRSMIAEALGTAIHSSLIYRTPEFPAGIGGDFANAVIRLTTSLPPEELLAQLHAIESRFGRQRLKRWGERSIDIDLLAVGSAVLPDPATQTRWRNLGPQEQARRAPEQLILPHPRLQDRAFVLVPWAEIDPDWVHPLTGQSVARMLAALPADEVSAVRPWRGMDWNDPPAQGQS